MATDGDGERVISARLGLAARIARLFRYRELLVGMVRKELKVKYKNSFLGFAWSLVNPLLYLVVFYVAFQLILGAGIPSFPIFLLSGLLVWNLFSVGVAGATGSVVANAGIVTKVYFPREILPLSAVGAALVHFVLQGGVLLAVLAVLRWDVAWSYMAILPLALVVLLAFTAGLGLLLGAVNVYLRDTEHLVELALLAWFWLTPIVYGFETLRGAPRWVQYVFVANPITPIVIVFQRALYGIVAFETGGAEPGAGPASLERLANSVGILPDWSVGAYAAYVAAAGAVSVAMFLVGLWTFGRIEANFAEEL